MSETVFTTSNTLDEWVRQGHNTRTRAAWEHGVKVAALMRGRMIYEGSSADYSAAERFGYFHARKRIQDGERWECGECRQTHGEDPAP